MICLSLDCRIAAYSCPGVEVAEGPLERRSIGRSSGRSHGCRRGPGYIRYIPGRASTVFFTESCFMDSVCVASEGFSPANIVLRRMRLSPTFQKDAGLC